MASSSLLCLRRPLPLPGRFHVRSSDLSLRPDNPNPIVARDRSKNRKPIQRGRYLSIEAIQAVQSLKRAKINGGDSLEAVMQSKVHRLVKRDLVSVLMELLNQGEGFLALQVVVGSFIAEGKKEPKHSIAAAAAAAAAMDPSSAPGKLANSGPKPMTGANSPPSRGTLRESSGGTGSPMNQSTGTTCNNSNQQGMASMPWK